MRRDQKALADIYSRIITESNGRKVIEGDVDLRRLYLTELPEWLADVEVEGGFTCSLNRLTSLIGAPKSVGEYFACVGNKLTTLQGAPKVVGTSFVCNDNKLTSLIGAPETVGTYFWCDNNRLTSLQGAPKVVKGDFDCSSNNLKSLQGGPEIVEGAFFCTFNKLTTLKGAPKNVGGGEGRGGFYCHDNAVKFTEADVRAVSDVYGKIIGSMPKI
jgi:hypothetical protein